MKTRPIVAAQIDLSTGVPSAPAFGDIYHPRAGALQQARHVFLGGNGLPERWAGRDRFVILEAGFGLGNNFLATWDAWRADPARPRRLIYVGIERHPPSRADLARVPRDAPLLALAGRLVDAWPPLTPGLHPIDFDDGRVQLLLALGDIATLLPELRLQADAFYLDGYAPARNPAMWEPRILKALGRRAARGATLATWSVARALRDGLTSAGFDVELAAGQGGKREITRARYAPRLAPAAPPATPGRRAAVVIGAGLAGAFVARALADAGWAATVVDACRAPALQTSGNAGGIFHGTVHADDGPHSRLLRSGALLTQRLLRPLIDAGTLAGSAGGLLRLGPGHGAMQALIDRHGLPPDWVQAIDADDATARAGVRLGADAWFYPGAGWIAPAAWVRHALARPGIDFIAHSRVLALRRDGDEWQALDARGNVLAQAPVVVVANAGEARRLLSALRYEAPLQHLRGQVSGWRGAPTPLRLPVAGDGYALPLGDGLLCGATNSADDAARQDDMPRATDDDQNFERLQRLTGLVPPADPALRLARVGWRLTAADRMPLAGALPQPAGDVGTGVDQVRRWPRIDGLHVCSALGGRGITWAPLVARLVAARITGEPWPLEQSLADAIDPARWLVRAVRRASGAQG